MYLTNRFFQVLGAIVALFALAYPLPVLMPVAQTVLILLSTLTLTDWALLFIRKPRLTIRREAPAMLSLSDPNPVHLDVENKGNLALNLSIEEELPFQLQMRHFLLKTVITPGDQQRLTYQITPLSRGDYAFGHARTFATTQIGLVERRLALSAPQTASVYPSVIQMKQYELRAMRHIAHETGIKKMRRIGHSYEFEQIKNYNAGDDYRSINWKASGRRAALMVNQYEDERSQQVYCVVDKSRAMRMPFEGLTLMDYAINATLALSNIILKKNDKAGLLSFSDVMGATLKAERDSGQLHKILESLYREKERPVESNYELLYEAVRRLVSGRSLLILFTNFESSYALDRALPTLRRLNRSHLLVVVFFENTEIRALAAEPVHRMADIYQHTMARRFLYEKREMAQKMRQFGIQAVLTRPQDLTLNTINKYLELKSRGLI
ncbi:MAG: DUF58 domain-containing protein [Saprospiraceae bacterium]|nr:DUF58 domain-containing protein [Saprospiraceae bacterium]